MSFGALHHVWFHLCHDHRPHRHCFQWPDPECDVEVVRGPRVPLAGAHGAPSDRHRAGDQSAHFAQDCERIRQGCLVQGSPPVGALEQLHPPDQPPLPWLVVPPIHLLNWPRPATTDGSHPKGRLPFELFLYLFLTQDFDWKYHDGIPNTFETAGLLK